MRPNREHVHVREAKDAFKRVPRVRLIPLSPRAELTLARGVSPPDDPGFKARVIFLVFNAVLDRFLNEFRGGTRAAGKVGDDVDLDIERIA